MGRLKPIEFRSWMLPLFVLAISVPIVVAFALGGPGVGMAMGAVIAALIVVAAARARFDEEIEVAPAAPGDGGVLVVATAAIETTAAVDAVAAARSRAGGGAKVLVLAPALNSAVSHWLSDLRRARVRAQELLAVSLAVLATAGVEARGSVGDTDPLQATEDALRSFAAAEVVLVTRPRTDAKLVREVRRRLDRRVTVVEGDEVAGMRTPQPSRP